MEKVINTVNYIVCSQISTSNDKSEDISDLYTNLRKEDNCLYELDQYNSKDSNVKNYFGICDDYDTLTNNIDNILINIQPDKDSIYINIYIICFTFKDKQKLNKFLAQKPKKRKIKINTFAFFVSKEHKKKEYSIEVINNISNCIRFKKISDKDNESDKLLSELYAVKLEDLIYLYNDYGDDLFTDNVRYHLNTEKYNYVDRSIETTLKEHPELFWFYHNGITLLLKDDCINRNRVESISIDPNKQISIINGAQTIYTVSAFYYSLDENKKEDKEILDNIKKAYVLLRIVINQTEDENLSKDITKNLNTQKPVETEDLKFFDTRIQTINEAFADNVLHPFEIIRNGDEENETAITLINFLKFFAIAIMQRPGIARSNKTKLLQDENIWECIENDNKKEDFDNWYNNSFKVILDAKKKFSILKTLEKKEPALRYSKEFVLSYYYWKKKEKFNTSKINSFTEIESNNFENDVYEIINDFKKLKEKELLNSNYFKTDSNYIALRDELGILSKK